ncbi:exported hypothetical protein [Plantibacter sp. T3]|nr:exported hypothetical protein [Plantibacter sp. T3]
MPTVRRSCSSRRRRSSRRATRPSGSTTPRSSTTATCGRPPSGSPPGTTPSRSASRTCSPGPSDPVRPMGRAPVERRPLSPQKGTWTRESRALPPFPEPIEGPTSDSTDPAPFPRSLSLSKGTRGTSRSGGLLPVPELVEGPTRDLLLR